MTITTSKAYLKKRRKQARVRTGIIIAAIVLVAVLAIVAIVKIMGGSDNGGDNKETTTVAAESSGTVEDTTAASVEETTTEEQNNSMYSKDPFLAAAQKKAYMYDYDAAIAMLKGSDEYMINSEYQDAVADFTARKMQCVRWADNTQIPHIFFHTLIVDNELAFDGDFDSGNYNQVMTTVSEFNKVLEQMYERGYVLISIYDMASMKTDENGNQIMTKNDIYLPEGKKPFVMSQDDVSYYEYMTGDGFATKLIVGADGKVTNEYINRDGSISYGSYDMIPLLDDFIEEHPDFSYRGAKGIIALTGYEGVLGYRTSEYSYGANSSTNTAFLYYNPNIEADRVEAKKVADALKEDGWLFASHGWGHRGMGQHQPYGSFAWDIQLWYDEVTPIIGPCDILIYPKGDDIGTWRTYTDANQFPETLIKYQLCKALGFNYYCNVDSTPTWVQITDQYVRQGRRNIDGTRLFEAVCGYRDLLSDIIDPLSVWDNDRPQPVEGVPVPQTTVAPETEEPTTEDATTPVAMETAPETDVATTAAPGGEDTIVITIPSN